MQSANQSQAYPEASGQKKFRDEFGSSLNTPYTSYAPYETRTSINAGFVRQLPMELGNAGVLSFGIQPFVESVFAKLMTAACPRRELVAPSRHPALFRFGVLRHEVRAH